MKKLNRTDMKNILGGNPVNPGGGGNAGFSCPVYCKRKDTSEHDVCITKSKKVGEITTYWCQCGEGSGGGTASCPVTIV
jgi:hypothetical protein